MRDDSDPLVGHVITRMPCDTCDLSLEELVVRAASIDLGRDIYEFSDINLHIRGPVLAARQQDGTFVLPQDALEASIWYRVDGLLQSTTEIVDRPVTITIDWSAGTIELEPTIGLDENTTATIHVLARTVPNVAPNALATTALATVECTGNRRATVQLRGSDSSDADGDPLSFVWVENFRNTDPNVHAIVLSHEANPSVSLELGVHDISLQVTDPFGNEGVARVVVEVVDTQAPTGVTATVAPDCLWPTNNRWRTFDLGEELQVQAIDTCSGAVSYALTAITAVEGSGAVSEGYALLGTQSFCVQAKRSGRAGSSRTYRVEGLATDPEGNTSSFDVAVQVPHNSNQCSNPVSATSAACEQALVQSDAGVPPSISSDKILATDDANRRERAHASDHVSGCSVASRPLRSSIGFVSLMSICTILVASLRRRSRK